MTINNDNINQKPGFEKENEIEKNKKFENKSFRCSTISLTFPKSF